MNTQAIKSSISHARLSTYEAACPQDKNVQENAVKLYAWNAQVSASLLAPLHICEVVIRNAVAEALEAVYGSRWPWSQGFIQSLPSPRVQYDPTRDLQKARRNQPTTGKVIPELKFVFWQKLFTRRFDQRIWDRHIHRVFPNLPKNKTVRECSALIYHELDAIRLLRNRIAHHEPIFSRDLAKDLDRIAALIMHRCYDTADWMHSNQDADKQIRNKPTF